MLWLHIATIMQGRTMKLISPRDSPNGCVDGGALE
jgi:hypothetical protein